MANTGVAPPNFTTDVGKVRALLGDTDPTDVAAGEGTYMYFSDDEIGAFLTMYGDNVKLAAARCLETISSSQALLLKSWSSDDLTVNGDKVAESLRKLAAQLREEALQDESNEYFNMIAMFIDDDNNGQADEYPWWNN
jgi:hypothetical protein